MKLKFLVITIFAFSLSACAKNLPIVQSPSPSPQDQNVNWQAGFAIFTNGTFRVFSASMYHNLASDVYIESSNPNIVHVKKSGLTWGDFFNTLPMELNNSCLTTGTKERFCNGPGDKLRFYLNSQTTNDLLSRQIQNGDRALISFGSEKDEEIKIQYKSVLDLNQ